MALGAIRVSQKELGLNKIRPLLHQRLQRSDGRPTSPLLILTPANNTTLPQNLAIDSTPGSD